MAQQLPLGLPMHVNSPRVRLLITKLVVRSVVEHAFLVLSSSYSQQLLLRPKGVKGVLSVFMATSAPKTTS